jgi:hypothetical protein
MENLFGNAIKRIQLYGFNHLLTCTALAIGGGDKIQARLKISLVKPPQGGGDTLPTRFAIYDARG